MTSPANDPHPRSRELFARSCERFPGGVNSPVRAFGAVGGTPRFVRRAEGAYVYDADGHRYLDLVGSWGPMILGHRHPAVERAIAEALAMGTSFGAPTERELELADRVVERYPLAERLRFTNSGTEATMSALRVARGATGRRLIVKFTGGYHGHADGLLVAAGSGAVTTGVPSSAGVPAEVAALTLVAPYNDAQALGQLFAAHGDDVAAVIVEPVAGNMGVVEPTPAFLRALRETTARHGALLVVDEVMTGFRLARGGAIERYGIDADLVCWGKVIGGGLPVGAYGGRAEVMDLVSPLGRVYQAGTLSGNPLAMAAGAATLDAIDATPGLYAGLEAAGERLADGLRQAAADAGVPVVVNQVGSMLTVFFTDDAVIDMESASRADTESFARWFHGMLRRGVWWPPSQFEAAFLSAALDENLIDELVTAATAAFAEVTGH
ncbi:MAG: glutamate-1-semialdehyde 2,1-aminomutase [Trueperaceae bacterium]